MHAARSTPIRATTPTIRTGRGRCRRPTATTPGCGDVPGHRRKRPHDPALPQTSPLVDSPTMRAEPRAWTTAGTPRASTRLPSMLIAFNKPYGVLCQFTDRSLPPRPTLAGFSLPAGIYPAGRLDFDSEGLLLLTDDGGLAHRLTDPRHKQPKTYWVQVEGEPGRRNCRPCEGRQLNDGSPGRGRAPADTCPVAARSTDPDAQDDPGCLAGAHPARRPQPPGAAHDRGGRTADAAPGAGRDRRGGAGRPAPGQWRHVPES